jgi:uncharacterized membrane protein (UPF0127 family)
MRPLPLVVVVVIACLVGCPSTAAPDAASPAARRDDKPATTTSTAKQPQTGLATGVVVVNGKAGPQRFRVQLATTNKEREKGLMFVEQLDDDAGMIFFFERQQQLSFWMKNTYLPLDMFFIDEDLVVKGIVENAEPLTTSARRIDGPTRFVLEVKGGTARKLGLGAGDRVQFEGIAPALWQKTTSSQETP